MTVLKNEFHGTEYKTHLTREELVGQVYGYVMGQPESERIVRRIRTRLCGVAGCQCAQDDFGQNRKDDEGLIH